MDAKLTQTAALFRIHEVAELLIKRKGTHDIVGFQDALRVFPWLKEKASVGYDGRGAMAFKVLAHNKVAGRLLVLAAMQDCAAPPHMHPGGEHTLSLIGKLYEHPWSEGTYSDLRSLDRWAPRLWGGMSFHQPFTERGGFWLGLYDYSAGLVMFDKMDKEQLSEALALKGRGASEYERFWGEFSLEEARAIVAGKLALRMPPGTPKIGTF